MALTSVLWGIGLLSIVSVSFLWGSTISYRLARNSVELSQIDAVAEAAVNRAALSLLDQRPESHWRTDGVAYSFGFGGASLKVSIQDELGRIDLNSADTPLLSGLFRSAGLDAVAADRLVDKILDWRDLSPAKRLNGAKDREYQAAGFGYRPRNGPFQSVDELKLVMDMTPDLFRRVEPAITVYSGRPLIDPQVAPREALLALTAMDAQKADSIIAARTADSNRAALSAPGIAATAQLPVAGRAFTVTADIERSNGTVTRQAVIRMTEDPARPYWILAWKGR
jgi:general secretion pathway protein K